MQAVTTDESVGFLWPRLSFQLLHFLLKTITSRHRQMIFLTITHSSQCFIHSWDTLSTTQI